MSAVSFDSGGVRCAGVHLRGAGEDFADAEGRRPCVVLGHGFAGTVDSGLMPYAEGFAAAGLDALAFDYRHFGLSDGEPRQLLSIPAQLADYAAAIAFARTLDGVDPDRIVLWGSSYSGGHVVVAAVADGRVAAVIAQTPAMDGMQALVKVARYAGLGILLKLTLAGLRDLAGSLRGRPPAMVPVVAAPGSVGVMTSADAEPGYRAIAGASWRNEVAARIALSAGSYRPGRQADRLPCPILVQIADRDAVAPVKAAQDAAWLATGRSEVRTYPIGHFEVYTGEPFARALADQLHFLGRHTRAGAGAAGGAPAGADSVAGTDAREDSLASPLASD
jgi:pimeloyl-ACP methyl ester carboxylesterase